MARSRSTTSYNPLVTLYQVGSVSGFSDEELVQRIVDKSAEHYHGPAFEAIVARHGPMVLRVCRRILGDAYDIEDAFQATFLQLHRQRSIVRGKTLGGWLHDVAYRTAKKARNESVRRRIREGAQLDSESIPGKREKDRDIGTWIDGEVSRLASRYRIVVILHYFESMSHQEVADQLGIPVATVNSRLARARKKLRERLTRQGVTAPDQTLSSALVPFAVKALVPKSLSAATVRLACEIAGGGAPSAVLPASVAALIAESSTRMTMRRIAAVAIVGTALGMALTGMALSLTSKQTLRRFSQPSVAPANVSPQITERQKALREALWTLVRVLIDSAESTSATGSGPSILGQLGSNSLKKLDGVNDLGCRLDWMRVGMVDNDPSVLAQHGRGLSLSEGILFEEERRLVVAVIALSELNAWAQGRSVSAKEPPNMVVVREGVNLVSLSIGDDRLTNELKNLVTAMEHEAATRAQSQPNTNFTPILAHPDQIAPGNRTNDDKLVTHSPNRGAKGSTLDDTWRLFGLSLVAMLRESSHRDLGKPRIGEITNVIAEGAFRRTLFYSELQRLVEHPLISFQERSAWEKWLGGESIEEIVEELRMPSTARDYGPDKSLWP